MSALAQLQATFAAGLRGDEFDRQLLRARRGSESDLFRIYRHAYVARLKEVLRDNYSLLSRAMGDEAFDALAARYVARRPSRTPSIRWYGEALAEVVRTERDLALHPALADLATMEWALRGAFDAADAPVVKVTDLAAIPGDRWGDLRFTLSPSFRMLELHWTVEPVWRALDGFEPEQGSLEPVLPEPIAHTHWLLVWRRDLQPAFRSLEDDEVAALDAVRRGECFAQVCACLADRLDAQDASLRAVELLQRWLADELVSGWSLE